MNDLSVVRYIGTMTLAGRLLDKGLITRKEFLAFEERLRAKYSLDRNSIYRDFHLLSMGRKR